MNNEEILKYYQNINPMLNIFKITNNTLLFQDNNITYTVNLNNINLDIFNSNFFLLPPQYIYYIIHILEILNKDNINESEINYIKEYTNYFLKVEKERIEGNLENENLIAYLQIPIYRCYDKEYENKPASSIIQEILYHQNEDLSSGKSNVQRLVLTNPNFPKTYDDDNENPFIDLGKTGFTVLFIIITTVIITSIYITYFILSY